MKKIFSVISALIDFAVITAALPVARAIMIKSPLFDANAPQWNADRYFISSIFAAATYFLLALTGGFYSFSNKPSGTKIPAMNFGYFLFLFCLGLLACWRFAAISDGAVFISKRALLFALAVSYFITTSIHYFLNLMTNKE